MVARDEVGRAGSLASRPVAVLQSLVAVMAEHGANRSPIWSLLAAAAENDVSWMVGPLARYLGMLMDVAFWSD